MKKYVSVIFALHLVSMNLFARTNGELLIWMDSDRGYALAPAAKKFETEFGIKVTIESPEKITDSFSIAAQAGKGPDIVIWAHDKLGEWADVKDNALLQQLKVRVDYGEVMPNVPQMGRFFSSLGAALQIATDDQASAEAALLEAKANMRHE